MLQIVLLISLIQDETIAFWFHEKGKRFEAPRLGSRVDGVSGELRSFLGDKSFP